VEYALRNCKSPISVSSYETKIYKTLPKKFKSSLPTVEEIEAELSTVKTCNEKKNSRAKKKTKS